MRKVHLISITDPLMLDLAMAIRDKGYEVSVSGNRLSSEQMCLLEERGIICYGNGWFPEKLTKDTYSIVLGCQVSLDNPELQRGKELGLMISSVPEFIYQCTKSKTRVVIAGSHGRRAILSLMVAALSRQKMAFDYATTSRVAQLAKTLQFSFESRIALIEGDEHITSVLDKRSQLEFYRPHIAVMTNMVWDSSHDHATPEAYMKTYRYFSTSIEREGKLIYYGGDPVIGELVEDIQTIQDAFAHFKPSVEVDFVDEDGGSVNEVLHFSELRDFEAQGGKGRLVENSQFLSGVKKKIDTSSKIRKSIEQNRKLRDILKNSTAKEELKEMLQAMLEELESNK